MWPLISLQHLPVTGRELFFGWNRFFLETGLAWNVLLCFFIPFVNRGPSYIVCMCIVLGVYHTIQHDGVSHILDQIYNKTFTQCNLTYVQVIKIVQYIYKRLLIHKQYMIIVKYI